MAFLGISYFQEYQPLLRYILWITATSVADKAASNHGVTFTLHAYLLLAIVCCAYATSRVPSRLYAWNYNPTPLQIFVLILLSSNFLRYSL